MLKVSQYAALIPTCLSAIPHPQSALYCCATCIHHSLLPPSLCKLFFSCGKSFPLYLIKCQLFFKPQLVPYLLSELYLTTLTHNELPSSPKQPIFIILAVCMTRYLSLIDLCGQLTLPIKSSYLYVPQLPLRRTAPQPFLFPSSCLGQVRTIQQMLSKYV